MEEGGWIATIAVLIGVVAWIWRRAARREGARCPAGKGLYPECLYSVSISSDEVRVRRPDGTASSLRLADLTRVTVATNESGPWGADVWWLWQGSATFLEYPQGATGDPEALALLEKLPGYDDHAVIKAMGCTSNQTFVVYTRPT